MFPATYHIVSTASSAGPDPLDLALLVALLVGLSYLTYELVEKGSTTKRQLVPPSAIIVGALIGLAISFVYLPTLSSVPMSPQQAIVVIPAGASSQSSTSGFFVPSNITVVLGVNNTVGWRNLDPAIHSAHSDAGLWFSGNIPAAQGTTIYTNYYTFTQSGSNPYHCNQHVWMFGLIVVKGK